MEHRRDSDICIRFVDLMQTDTVYSRAKEAKNKKFRNNHRLALVVSFPFPSNIDIWSIFWTWSRSIRESKYQTFSENLL